MKKHEVYNTLLKELGEQVDVRHRANLDQMYERHSLVNQARQSETGFVLAMLTGYSEAPWSGAPDVADPAALRRALLSEIRSIIQTRRDGYAVRGASEPHAARLIESDAILEMIDGLAATPFGSREAVAYRQKRIPAPAGFDPRRHSGCIWVKGRLLPCTRDLGPCNRTDGLLLVTVHHPDGARRAAKAPLEHLIRKRQFRMPRHHARRAAAPQARPETPPLAERAPHDLRAMLLDGL